ncbi:MAG: pantetheine-phosphate adenylyltransferase [Dehalococcoidia bacterium]|jgi:pantetheine-phosphate adenylyltransferase|nr:MAG: pantetheine-phosphate adenylyltransferase [Dehalococcoidia bacterium]TEU16358.1 MAG: pantetheine-phosphate adenylyltransferase [Dehalococcoidia bacterium]
MDVAVYPGTFDPLTYGHMDIIERAAALVGKLIVGIYENPAKQPLFPLEQRVRLVEEAITGLSNVHVKAFKGLTVDFIRQVGGRVMIRGLRANSDFEREFEMALMNRKLAPDIELLCLMTSSQYQFLSSSLIKEVAKLGGCLEGMVPDYVAVALREKFSTPIELATGKDKM